MNSVVMLTTLLTLVVVGIAWFVAFRIFDARILFRYPTFHTINLLVVFTIQLCIGSYFVVNRWESHYIISTIGDGSIRLEIWFVSLMALLAYVLVAAALTGPSAKIALHEFFGKPVMLPATGFQEDALKMLFTLFLIVSLAVAFHVMRHLPVPITELFASLEDVGRARFRSEMRFNFSGNQYVYNLWGKSLMPVLTFTAMGYALQAKNGRKFWMVIFALFFFSTMFVQLADLQKAPAILFLGGNILLLSWLKGGMSLFRYLLTGVFLVALLVTQFIFFSGSDGVASALKSAFYRFSLTQIAGMYVTVDLFPAQIPYVQFGELPEWINKLLQSDSTNVARMTMEYVNPEGIRGGTAGLLTTIYLGQAYASFGWIGVAVMLLLVPIILQIVYLKILTAKKDPVSLGVLAYLSIEVPLILMRASVEFFYSPRFIFLFLVFGFVRFYEKQVARLDFDSGGVDENA